MFEVFQCPATLRLLQEWKTLPMLPSGRLKGNNRLPNASAIQPLDDAFWPKPAIRVFTRKPQTAYEPMYH